MASVCALICLWWNCSQYHSAFRNQQKSLQTYSSAGLSAPPPTLFSSLSPQLTFSFSGRRYPTHWTALNTAFRERMLSGFVAAECTTNYFLTVALDSWKYHDLKVCTRPWRREVGEKREGATYTLSLKLSTAAVRSPQGPISCPAGHWETKG